MGSPDSQMGFWKIFVKWYWYNYDTKNIESWNNWDSKFISKKSNQDHAIWSIAPEELVNGPSSEIVLPAAVSFSQHGWEVAEMHVKKKKKIGNLSINRQSPSADEDRVKWSKATEQLVMAHEVRLFCFYMLENAKEWHTQIQITNLENLSCCGLRI